MSRSGHGRGGAHLLVLHAGFCLCLVAMPPAAIALDVEGSVAGTWAVTHSPIVITSGVTVLPATTLVVEAGVLVKSAKINPSIQVFGTLEARGPTVVFQAANIAFEKGSTGLLRGCRFVQDASTGHTSNMVSINDCSPRLEGCVFETEPNSHVDGVLIANSEAAGADTSPLISGCRFKNLGRPTQTAALTFTGTASRLLGGLVENCLFEDCEAGIVLQTFFNSPVAPRFRATEFLVSRPSLNRVGIDIRTGDACAAPLGVIVGTATGVVSPVTGNLVSLAVQARLQLTGPVGRLGDVDGDGRLTVADAVTIQAAKAGLPSGDIDFDGKAEAYDARLLVGFLAGLLPEGEK